MNSPSLTPNQLIPHPDAINLLPATVAATHKLLPIRASQGQLVCAGPGPFDLNFLTQLQFQVQRHLTLVKVPEDIFEVAFEKQYGSRLVPQAESLLDSICSERPKYHAIAPNNPMEWATQQCRTTVIIGTAGGVGATSIATNLAVQLTDRNHKVAYLDANFSRPAAHIALGTRPTYTIRDLARNRTNAWEALTSSFSGIRLLAGEPGAVDLASMEYADLAALGATPDHLAEHFDHFLIDLPSHLDDPQMSFINRANLILLVTNDEPSALHNTLVFSKTILANDATANIHVLFNQVANEKSARQAFLKLRAHLGEDSIRFAGAIEFSKQMERSWQCRTPLASLKPNDASMKALNKIQAQLLPNRYELQSQPTETRLAQTS
jgi:flagellar biosynthesis protein FlhG